MHGDPKLLRRLAIIEGQVMTWKTGLGYGFLVWTVLFAAVSAALIWGIYDSAWAVAAIAVIAAVVSYSFASLAHLRGGSAFTHSLLWVAIAVALDYLVSYRFDTTLFASWPVWIGYGAIVLGPLLETSFAPEERPREHYPVHAA